jgi:hypothetical protein
MSPNIKTRLLFLQVTFLLAPITGVSSAAWAVDLSPPPVQLKKRTQDFRCPGPGNFTYTVPVSPSRELYYPAQIQPFVLSSGLGQGGTTAILNGTTMKCSYFLSGVRAYVSFRRHVGDQTPLENIPCPDRLDWVFNTAEFKGRHYSNQGIATPEQLNTTITGNQEALRVKNCYFDLTPQSTLNNQVFVMVNVPNTVHNCVPIDFGARCELKNLIGL